jgi:hypothetical protein
MLKNVKYINSSNIQKSETERYKETPAYKYETQKLMNFMDEIGNYTSMEISNPNEIIPNDIILTPNNSFGVVLSNNSGIVKYLTNPAPDKFEVQDDK